MAGSADLHDCDAVISIDGVQFNVHKLILCGCSTYFQALFLRQSAPDRKMFEVPGLSAATMQLIIEFAYTGSMSVTEDNVQELLEAADQFNIISIEQACCNYLLEKLSSENCIGIWQLCNICLSISPKQQQKSHCYLLSHFEEAVLRDELQKLSVQEMSGILNSDELHVRQESTLCEAIFKWVDYESAERQQHLTMLLSKVRLALTSQSFLTDLMNTEAVSSNAECMEIVHQAQKLKTYMSMLTPSLSVCSNQAARPRLPNAILISIGINNIDERVVEVYDYHADRWNSVPCHGACPDFFRRTVHCNGFVYFFHGGNGDLVRRFDLTTHTWLEVASMQRRRSCMSVTVLDGFIYAIGGICKYLSRSSYRMFTLRSAERYDPQTNRWSLISSMLEPRSSANCTSLHNMIYICGGYNEQHSLDTCECYCPEANQWTSFTPMRRRRAGLGVIAYENLIFAVGGKTSNNALKSVEAYDPRTETWRAVSSMLTCRSHFGIAVLDNKIFVLGGYNSNRMSVECYDMSTNLWSEVCKLEECRLFSSCFVVSGIPNVAEYVISRDNLPRLDEEGGLVES